MSRTIVTALNFPASGANRTRKDATAQIASYIGGGNNPAQITRAGYCWDEAVQRYNSVWWTFNRERDDITLTATNEFDLEGDFGAPERAFLLNSSSERKNKVNWIPFEELVDREEDNSGTATMPTRYSIFNPHGEGKVRVYPTLGSSITYPTLRILYFKRIAKASGPNSRLDVPVEVDQGIFDLAVAIMIARTQGPSASRAYFRDAEAQRIELERTWRGYPDIPVYE